MIGREIVPTLNIQSSAEDDTSAVFGNYFIASKDGQHFSHILSTDVESALAQNMFVYVVDDPTVIQPIDLYLGGENIHVSDENCNTGTSNTILYLNNTTIPVVNPTTGSDMFQQVSIPPADQLVIPPTASTSHPDSSDNVIPIFVPPLCATLTDINLATASTEIPLKSYAEKQKRLSRKSNTERICPVCQKYFSTLRDYSNHMITHESERPHACSYCSEAFNQVINLKIHVAVHHYDGSIGKSVDSNRDFICPVCDYKPFSRRAAFHAHLLSHQCEETIDCILCHQVFLSVSLLNAHMSTEHSSVSMLKNNAEQFASKIPINNGYRCQKCGQLFSSVGMIRRHYRFSHPTPAHKVSVETRAETRNVTSGSVTEGPRLSKIRAVNYVSALIKQQQRRHSTSVEQYEEFICKLPDENVPAVDDHMNYNHSSRKRGKKRTFPCSYCKRQFTSRCMLSRHILKHTKSKPYECRICHARFSQKSSVKTHLALHINQSRQACPLCKRCFKFSTNLILHLQSVHHVNAEIVENVGVDVDNAPCGAENTTFVWQYQPIVSDTNPPKATPVLTEDPTKRISHDAQQASMHQDCPYCCSVCHKRFTLRRSLSIHMLRHSPSNLPYACHLCSRRFATLAHKNYHVATHSTQAACKAARAQRIACLKAGKRIEINRIGPLVWNSDQNAYVSVDDIKAAKVRPHMCPYCPKAYLHAHHLALHVRQQHCPNQAPYACDKCTRRFISDAGLTRHMTSRHLSNHSKMRRYPCNVCLITFSAMSSLRRHMLVHTTEKSHKCHLCHRKFRHLSSCRRHMNRHVNESTASELFTISSKTDTHRDEVAMTSPDIVIESNPQQLQLTTTSMVPSISDLNSDNVHFTGNKLSNYSAFDGVIAYDVQNVQHSKSNQSTAPTLYPAVYVSSEQQTLSTMPVDRVYYLPVNESAAVGTVSLEGVHNGAPDLQHETLQPTVQIPPTVSSIDRNDPMPKTNWSLYLTYNYTDGSCELPHAGKTLPIDESTIVETFNTNTVIADESEQVTVDPLSYCGTSDLPEFITNASYIIDLDATESNVNTPYEVQAPYIDNIPYQTVIDEQISIVEKAPAAAEYAVVANAELSQPFAREEQCTDMNTTIVPSEIPTDTRLEYFGCGRCSATFNNGPELLKHSQLYHLTVPKPYSCSHCFKAFASEVLLQAHDQLEHGPGNERDPRMKTLLHCPACKTTTTTSSALTRHILACHPMSCPDPFRCMDCGMTFRHLRSLKVHITTKAYSKSIDSGLTIKKTRNKARKLKRKVDIVDAVLHTNSEVKRTVGRPPKIQISESDSAINEAIRLSVGATTCPVCGRSFKLSSDLKRHVSVHSGIRPHPCPQCPRSFLKHCQLTQHLNSAHVDAITQSEPQITSNPSGNSDRMLPLTGGSATTPSVTEFTVFDISDKEKPQMDMELSEPTTLFSYSMATEASAQQMSDFSVPLTRQPLLPLIEPSDYDKSLLDLALPSDPSLTPFMSPNPSDSDTVSFKTLISCKQCGSTFPNCSEYKAHACCQSSAVKHKSLAKAQRFSLLHRCVYCDKTFSQAWLLRRHEAGHVRQQGDVGQPDDCDKLFQCPYCAQGFAQCGNMKRHMSTVHRGCD